MEEVAFGVLKIQDLLLHGVLRDELDGCDGFCLADTMRAVRRLVFDHRIPPLVEMDDGVRSREIQTRSASLEAEKENWYVVAVVELIDMGLTILC